MVVLVHEGDRENPVVLDLPKGGKPGEFPCCLLDCRSLDEHLSRLWPDHLVERALRFSRPEDPVLVSRFDNSIFDHRTNDLYVKCKRRAS